MKKIALFTVTSIIAASAQALPFLLEKSEVNHAWGLVDKGCAIDTNGQVYSWDMANQQPVTAINRKVSQEEMKDIYSRIYEAKQVPVVIKHVAADAGAITWKAFYGDDSVLLKLRGDYQAENSSAAGKALADLLDKNCILDVSEF